MDQQLEDGENRIDKDSVQIYLGGIQNEDAWTSSIAFSMTNCLISETVLVYKKLKTSKHLKHSISLLVLMIIIIMLIITIIINN